MNLGRPGTLFKTIFSVFVEALFPLSGAEKELFSMTPEEAFTILPRAPQPPIPDVSSVFAYKDERAAKLVWNIKYKKSAQAVDIGAFALYQVLTVDSAKTLIIPMPITPKRRRERGFNQCELLVDELERLDTCGAPSDSAANQSARRLEIRKDILLRTHHSSRQTLKNRADRLESAKGIFSVTANSPLLNAAPDCRVIVIDDVITTGSTMKEAMETLRSAGFKNVRGLSVAH